MKKFAYIFGGFILGAVVVMTGDTVAAKVSSMVGKTVTGEYSVTVNGKELADKGAVIDGRTNVPLRAYSEALGANIQIEGRTIHVTTETTSSTVHPPVNAQATVKDGPYAGGTRSSLETLRASTENNVLKRLTDSRAHVQAEIDKMKAASDTADTTRFEAELKTLDADIAKYTQQLAEIDAAIASLAE